MTPGHVFDQTAKQPLFFRKINDDRRDFGRAERDECVDAAFAIDEVEAILIALAAATHLDRLFQSDRRDAFLDFIVLNPVTFARVDDPDLYDRDHLDGLFFGLIHAASSKRQRHAMRKKKSSVSKR